jgi:hypothetical protein
VTGGPESPLVYLYNVEEDRAARFEAIHAKLPTVAVLLCGTKHVKTGVIPGFIPAGPVAATRDPPGRAP